MQSAKIKIESYPAPSQLATETDLSPHEVKAVTEAVNPLIADAFALYVKTKNFHWHLYALCQDKKLSETTPALSRSPQIITSSKATEGNYTGNNITSQAFMLHRSYPCLGIAGGDVTPAIAFLVQQSFVDR
jgi:hypothetical protein